jgi:hypothetical protein
MEHGFISRSAHHSSRLSQSPLFVVQASHDPVHMDFAHSLGACSGEGMGTDIKINQGMTLG